METLLNTENSQEKEKVLQNIKTQIERRYGKGSIMKMDGKDTVRNIDVIHSGAISLDEVLGIGGYPKGRIVEIYGPESSGKTTLALHAIAQTQKAGGIAAFVDAEHALDPIYAEKLGINIKELWLSQPDTGEQALEIVEQLVRSSAVDIIVIDSVAALTPQAEIEGAMGDSHMGLQARLMSQALRKLTSVISKTNCCLIFINQLRMKIGLMFGNPETTTGGNALKFYASLRLEVRRIEGIGKNTEEQVGNRVRIRAVKNKLAPPFRKTELEIHFGKGISSLSSLVDTCIKYNIIEKAGSWYSYQAQSLGQGKDNVLIFLKDNPQLIEDFDSLLRKKLFPAYNKELEVSTQKISDITRKRAGAEEKLKGVPPSKKT